MARYQPPPQRPQPSQLQQLIQLIILLEAQQAQEQAAQQRKEKEGGNSVTATLKKAKQVYDAYRTGKGLYDDIGNAISSSTTGGLASGGMSTMGGSAPATTGFSGIEEMVGNGLYSEAPGSMMQTPAGDGGTTWGDIAPYLNTAISAYNAYRTLNNKNMEQDQKNLALAGAAAQASTPYTGGWGSAAAGAFNAGSALAGKGTEEEKTQAAAHQAGMAVANYWTAGLAGLADGYARDQWGGTMKKVDKFMWNNPLGAMYGLNLATRPFDTDAWKKEGNRLRELEKKGVKIPDSMKLPMMLKRGRTKDELINKNYAQDYIGETSDGWVNNKFASSRDVNDLRKEDIWGYAAFQEKFGNDWYDKFNEKQRADIAQAALDNKAVKEHHGTIDINWTPELDATIGKITAGNSTPIAQPQQQIQRPGKGQVARVSPGMYMNDRGQIVTSATRQGAMKNSYQIPKTGRK